MTTYYVFDHAGYFTNSTEQKTERSTETAPINLSVTEVEGELRSNWTGYVWKDIPYIRVEKPVIKEQVPVSVTRRQALQQLTKEGLDDDIEIILSSIPDVMTRKLMTIWYRDSQVFERNRPEILQVWNALGRTSEQLDNTFIAASKL